MIVPLALGGVSVFLMAYFNNKNRNHMVGIQSIASDVPLSKGPAASSEDATNRLGSDAVISNMLRGPKTNVQEGKDKEYPEFSVGPVRESRMSIRKNVEVVAGLDFQETIKVNEVGRNRGSNVDTKGSLPDSRFSTKPKVKPKTIPNLPPEPSVKVTDKDRSIGKTIVNTGPNSTKGRGQNV